jgi:hypothetical protein
MDKGFNDDELEDIMNEIESLEKEFTQVADQLDHEPSLEEVAKSVMSLSEDEEQDVDNSLLEQVAKMPVDEVIPQKKINKFDDDSHHNIIHLEKKSHIPQPKTQSNNTAMKFNIEGDMQMELSFVINGTEVNLQINDDGFEIELEGGAKFTLPVGHASAIKKVA